MKSIDHLYGTLHLQFPWCIGNSQQMGSKTHAMRCDQNYPLHVPSMRLWNNNNRKDDDISAQKLQTSTVCHMTQVANSHHNMHTHIPIYLLCESIMNGIYTQPQMKLHCWCISPCDSVISRHPFSDMSHSSLPPTPHSPPPPTEENMPRVLLLQNSCVGTGSAAAIRAAAWKESMWGILFFDKWFILRLASDEFESQGARTPKNHQHLYEMWQTGWDKINSLQLCQWRFISTFFFSFSLPQSGCGHKETTLWFTSDIVFAKKRLCKKIKKEVHFSSGPCTQTKCVPARPARVVVL